MTTVLEFRMSKMLCLTALGLSAFLATFGVVKYIHREPPPPAAPPGMVRIPGGEFTMGSNAFLPAEKPAHRVQVDSFLMDETDVTNAQFREFVEATGYVTTAEKVPTVEDIMRYSRPGATGSE